MNEPKEKIEGAAGLLEECVRLLRQHPEIYTETAGPVLAVAGFSIRAIRGLARRRDPRAFVAPKFPTTAEVLESAASIGIRGLVQDTPKTERRALLFALAGAVKGWQAWRDVYNVRAMARAT